MAKNECGKTRTKDKPYEVWAASGFEWRVLKKYQAEEAEASNPYARWFMATKGPGTYGNYELGDGYAAEVKRYGVLIEKDGIQL